MKLSRNVAALTLAAMFALSGSFAKSPAARNAANCRVDRAAALRLDERQFDQDVTGGWRALDMRGCEREAADLIRAYRLAKRRADEPTLTWHEGQERAGARQTARAIALFEEARKPPAEDRDGWNLYVDGTIAFLRRDRARLLRDRDSLAALPPPSHPETLTINGQLIQLPWPPNLNILDGFLKCFGQPYDVGYACAKPLLKVEVPDKLHP